MHQHASTCPHDALSARRQHWFPVECVGTTLSLPRPRYRPEVLDELGRLAAYFKMPTFCVLIAQGVFGRQPDS